MPCEWSSPKSIWGFALIVKLKAIWISLVHYTMGIISTIWHSWWHILTNSNTSISNQSTRPILRDMESSMTWFWANADLIDRMQFLLGHQTFMLLVYLAYCTWPIIQTIIVLCCSHSQLVIMEMVITGYLKQVLGFLPGYSHVSQKVPKIHIKHGIMQLTLC
jgi:hypothetical protein